MSPERKNAESPKKGSPKKGSPKKGVLGVFYARNNIFGPNCTIFVDNLGPNVAESMLFKTFNQIGVISSARVVRDSKTGKSLGQAYLNFVDPVDASRALSTMNGKLIDGRPVRLRRKKKETYLFIRNIPQEVSNQELQEKFEKFGKLASCNTKKDWKSDNEGHQGYGYIKFYNQSAADRAVDEANTGEGVVLHGKRLDVQYFQNWKERTYQMDLNDHTYTCIHIKGYPSTWTRKDVEALFETDRIKDPIEIDFATRGDGTSKAYSYVTFNDHDSAFQALQKLQGQRIDNEHALVVQRLMSNFERQLKSRKEYKEWKKNTHKKYKGRNLYVKDFPDDWDQSQLLNLFSKFGKVTSARIMKNYKGESKGFGFVCFESETSASTALTKMNNLPIQGKQLVVEHAELKQERKERLKSKSPRKNARYRGMEAGFSPRSRAYHDWSWGQNYFESYRRPYNFPMSPIADFQFFGYRGF